MNKAERKASESILDEADARLEHIERLVQQTRRELKFYRDRDRDRRT